MDKENNASIVIPLLEQNDAWLEQCVLSALKQTVPAAVLVVTSPNTPISNRDLLQRLQTDYPKLVQFERQAGAGFASAINEGWQRAKTRRVGLLLSDDWLSPDAVEQCLSRDADIVTTGLIGYAADGRQVLWQRPHLQAVFDALPTFERKAGYVSHFFLFRRECVLAVGGVDPTVGNVGPDDYDLPWTLLEQGASVAVINHCLYHYRDHDGFRLTLRPQQEQLQDLRRLLTKHGLDDAECEQLAQEKAKWYGVPCHVALANPDWYR